MEKAGILIWTPQMTIYSYKAARLTTKSFCPVSLKKEKTLPADSSPNPSAVTDIGMFKFSNLEGTVQSHTGPLNENVKKEGRKTKIFSLLAAHRYQKIWNLL
jgi:hypothetical protein